MTDTLPRLTCRSLLAGKLICRDMVLSRQIIYYKGPRLVHEPFVSETHSTSFFSRVIWVSALPPCELLIRAAQTVSPHAIATMFSDYLQPAGRHDGGLLISLEPTPAIVTVSQA